MATLLVIYDDRVERFKPEESDYWIARRIEKEGITPTEAYLVTDENKFDFQPAVDKAFSAAAQYDKDRRKDEYERLKAEFG